MLSGAPSVFTGSANFKLKATSRVAIEASQSTSHRPFEVSSQRAPSEDHTSAITGFLRVPMSLRLTSTTSPGFIFTVAPSVPIQIMSPGCKVR